MSSVTKHIFDRDIKDIISMWNDEIKSIQPLLPKVYTHGDIIDCLRKYYPHEWQYAEDRYIYYQIKDKHIEKRYHKARYNMPKPEVLIEYATNYKKILSATYKKQHFYNYSDENKTKYEEIFYAKRKPKIDRVNHKINMALSKTQQVTPSFIDKLIGLYEQKNTTQRDKVYILAELKKYYCNKIIQFLFKLNDTEINFQLRYDAFRHLQSFNYKPRLRKQQFMRVHCNNNKRKQFLKNVYAKEVYDIPLNPNELEYRIENSKEQRLKLYDYFISHSSKDSKVVQDLIIAENKLGMDVFCDWINDVDYLKRHLICDATLKVIEYRLQQSKAILFVESENSLNSEWCKYELNYFHELNRPIYYISKDSIINQSFTIKLLEDYWFVDSNYKEKALFIGKKINIEKPV